MYDEDKDGRISRSEWIRVFAKHDTNRDKQVSYDEFYMLLSQHAHHIC
jgi:Ca2+-binding EF-hand superfamily protein